MSKVLHTLNTIQGFVGQRGLFISLFVGLALLCGSVSAQNKTEVTRENGQDMVLLDLKEVDIQELINTVADVSGLNFIVDPRVKGKVTVLSPNPLDLETLYDVLLSVLDQHNFAAVYSDPVVKILPSSAAERGSTPNPYSRNKESNDAQVTKTISLGHASAQDLLPILSPLIASTGHIAPQMASNSLVVTDTEKNVQRVLAVVNRLDKSH